MDSRSRRLPFSVSGSRSSYTSSSSFSTSSSSSLGSSRLYGRDRVLSSDCFPRASSTLKPDADHQSSRYLSSTRDYSSSDSRSTSWKLPSPLTTSTTSYDRPWADSPLSSRNKLSDSERRLGAYSGLLNTSDDGDSKRAKLSCSNRGAYSRTPSTSVTGSLYSSNGRGSSTVAGAKQTDTWIDSPWSSCRLLSRSSSSSSSTSPKPLLSRRELETRHEPSLSGLGESRVRNPALSSSLYQSDRVTSTYAQGARPKETLYSSSSSTARESSLSRHLSSTSYRSSPLVRDFSTRTTARSLTNSSDLHSSQEQTGNPKSTSAVSSSHTSSWYTSPLAREDANLPSSPTTPAPPVPRPAPEGGESEGRRSTRRLLSRLFSRRSSQDSSSGSSSARSFDSTDDGSSTGGEAVDSEEAARPPSVEPDIRGSETAQAFAFLRRRRLDLAPIQETHSENHRGGPAQPSMEGWREPGASSNNSSSGGGGSSWLSASLRNRCPPLFSRHRREGRDESTRSAAEDSCSHLQQSLRRWDNPMHKVSEGDDDDDDEDEEEDEDDEEEVGAVGVEVPGAAGASTILVERTPGRLRDAVFLTPPPRVRLYEDIIVAVDSVDDLCSRPEGLEKDKPLPSRDPERLRKIKESLLLEESDEEEGDLCRICQMGEESASNPLIEPCSCTGSLQYVHQECIKKWLRSKVSSGTNLDAITTCELCKEKLHLNIDNFDINELYRTHVQSEYEFISSGLYLVVLLHLCEQRFSDVLGAANEAGFFNLARTLHEHMDNLESPPGETDEEVEWLQDTRPPAIDFSDLDDDLEEEY